MSASSTSLTSSIFDYKYENGRRYHAYRAGAYVLPNDELEQDRMDLRHHIFRLTLDGELFRAPLTKIPERVLDIGTGTGIWAMDFADEFPSAVVIGTDLSPIQPHWVPPNCRFVVDDAEADWLYRPDEAFDYIHGRALGGSIADWTRFYQQIYTHLKPGGWIEMQEYEAWISSDDDTINQGGKWVSEWQRLIDEASTKFGKKFNVAERQKQYMIEAGFAHVQDDVYKVCPDSVDEPVYPEMLPMLIPTKTPIGPWAKDRKLKEIGMYHRENIIAGVEPFCLALFTRVLGWSNAKTQVLLARVKDELRNPRNHFYTATHFIYGRKPVTTYHDGNTITPS